jgi:exosortase
MVLRHVTSPSITEPSTGTARLLNAVLWAVLFTLLLANYWPTLLQTAELLAFSDDMAQGFFAPIVAAYITWQRRSVAFPAGSASSAWGVFVLAVGAPLALSAALGGSTTLSRFAFMISLAGVIVSIGGYRAFRTLLFPWALLVFTFPIPAVLYGEITLPLQLLASRLSEMALELMGFSVIREGNVLELPRQRLSVVEACSGLRSLLTLAFFSLVYAHLLEPKRWLRAVIVAAAFPAAILLNVVRIVVTGVLGQYRPELTHGIYHDILGWLCLALGFGLVWLAHWMAARWAAAYAQGRAG